MPETTIEKDEVLIDRIGSAGIVRLNRPKALNSLNLGMVRAIKAAMGDFAEDPAISCVIMTGEGERGLCAGGDIRAIYQTGKVGDPDVTQFWREEFPLNHTIAHYPKPYVALMDGIVMGGGVGIAAHGKHRVVTERTRLAMPETGIGYFPDVGATWLLPQAPGEAGTWLGLTGLEIGAADAIHARLADVCLPSARLGDLVSALGALSAGATDADVRAEMDRLSMPAGESPLEANAALIDRVFGLENVEAILAALDREDGAFAEATRETLARRSPTSLKLTLRLLRMGRESSGLVECLEREFTAGVEVLRNYDFYEGVRAAIIDKDRNPKWMPTTLACVRDADIDRYLCVQHVAIFPDHRL